MSKKSGNSKTWKSVCGEWSGGGKSYQRNKTGMVSPFAVPFGRRAALSLVEGLHARLGASSGVSALPPEVIRQVADLLENDCYHPMEWECFVLDTGTETTKFGAAGEDTARVIMRTRVMDSPPAPCRGYWGSNLDGNEALINQSRCPLAGRLPESPETMEKLLAHLCCAKLQCSMEKQGLLASVPVIAPTKVMETLTQQAFEVFGVDAFYVARQQILQVYSSGLTSAIMVDSSADSTIMTSVYEGSANPTTLQNHPYGGNFVTDKLANLIAESQGLSLQTVSEKEKVKELKEMYASVGAAKEPLTLTHTLPDGRVIKIGDEFQKCTSLLFDEQEGYLTAIKKCIKNEENYSSRSQIRISVSGGNSLLPGFAEQMHSLKTKLPARVTVRLSRTPTLDTWIGGSILGSLGTFFPMMIFPAEYDDAGPRIVSRKCF